MSVRPEVRSRKFGLEYIGRISIEVLDDFLSTIGTIRDIDVRYLEPNKNYSYVRTQVYVEFEAQVSDRSKNALHKFCFGTSKSATCGKKHAIITTARSKKCWDESLPQVESETDEVVDNLPVDIKFTIPWQMELYDMWEDKDVFNKRSITWIYGIESLFDRGIFIDKITRVTTALVIPDAEGLINFSMLLDGAKGRKPGIDRVIIDADNSMTGMRQLYGAISKCKKGVYSSVCNGCKLEKFKPLPILVISESRPVVTMFSAEEWVLYELIDEELFLMAVAEQRKEDESNIPSKQ